MEYEKDVFINIEGKKNYIRVFEISKSAPNLIFIMTPIGSVGDNITDNFLKGLIHHSCNVFALDFLGIGRSEGSAKDISLNNMESSTLELINYIKTNYNDTIHFYGGTGLGGIIGQALVSSKNIGKYITSFSQYGVSIYKDTTTMANTKLLQTLYPLFKLLNKISPGSRMKFKIPSYNGVNAEKEEKWYRDVLHNDPKAFDFKISLFKVILDIFFSKKSPITNGINCNVFVLAPKYDRYYYRDYFNRYYENLNGPKEIFWIDGSHMSFDWKAEEINNKVLSWIRISSSNKKSV